MTAIASIAIVALPFAVHGVQTYTPLTALALMVAYMAASLTAWSITEGEA